ncbi:hypothetical protein GA0115254_108864 [Streptomyces sp. Ncost-T10-10d]|nr:hypothetical protein GA0115254_108864 [Streptomyces sp. Ncost-T10-10d]
MTGRKTASSTSRMRRTEGRPVPMLVPVRKPTLPLGLAAGLAGLPMELLRELGPRLGSPRLCEWRSRR